METDHISQLLARDPLMCHYEVVAKDTLPEVVSTYPSAFVCNTHNSDQPGEHWVAMYVDGAFCMSGGEKTFKDRHICTMVYGALLISARDTN